ncbi:PKD domain-containing protein [Pseudoalteromonas ruthenica]|uniref:PKD domain-containing protein n=1 Tax=Pseudoalteromonas ruthenica TaxID=151081 RepID=UPI00110A190C|nr:PKD domain-containing protein [Pseudoalteromonas ruthenica]TMO48362.1 hypothetical protein CWC23_17915 [Pseudoalteromonas ruthenica]TMO48753.1 hypothetical protein CWC24_03565 [Pseudoalteromonas ruthenica]
MYKGLALFCPLFCLTLSGCGGSDSNKDATPVVENTSQSAKAHVAAVTQAQRGQRIQLDATQSVIPRGGSFSWQWHSVPEDGAVELTDKETLKPTFIPTVAGTYQLKLVVDAGNNNSSEVLTTITVADSSNNIAPVARFELAQTHFGKNETIHLDASASFDADNDTLNYEWQAQPHNRSAEFQLSAHTGVQALFKAQSAGKYTIRLTVDDGELQHSTEGTVTVQEQSLEPVISAPSSVKVGTEIKLSAANSKLYEGVGITWQLKSKPQGSSAELSTHDAVEALFTADVAGTYLVQLRLTASSGEYVVATKEITATANNGAPFVRLLNTPSSSKTYQQVTLDGSATTDPDGDTLDFLWQIEAPEGATYSLENETSAKATFLAQDPGDYKITLQASDGALTSQKSLIHRVTSSNSAPSARIELSSGQVKLYKTASFIAKGQDPDGDVLTYQWQLINKPAQSEAQLSNIENNEVSFTFDKAGTYTLSVTASDGELSSEPHVMSVQVKAGTNRQPYILGMQVLDELKADQPIRLVVNAGDPDGDPLTYEWRVEPPTNATATFSSTSAAQTTITVSDPGWYLVEVYADDGIVRTPYPHAKVLIVE